MKKDKWLILAEKFQETLHRNKNWIYIDLTSYKGTKYKLNYHCTRHDFHGEASGAALLKSKGCPSCQSEDHLYKTDKYTEKTRTSNSKAFLEKAILLHGNKYTYDVDDYICSRTLMKIRCNVHGTEFLQRPSAHLQGQGCPTCALITSAETRTTSDAEFENIFNSFNKNPNVSYVKGTFSTYNNDMKLLCTVHGLFDKVASTGNHMKQPCTLCNKEARRLKAQEAFINKSKALYPDMFEYEDVYYVNNRVRVTLSCVKHGKFSVRPMGHVSDTDGHGTGCPDCAKISWGRWSPKVLMKDIELFEKEICYTYLMKLSDFYKIGITKNVTTRIKQIEKESGFTCEIVSLYKSNTYKSSTIEHYLKDRYCGSRFTNDVYFGGYTECFYLSDSQVHEIVTLLSNGDSFEVEIPK